MNKIGKMMFRVFWGNFMNRNKLLIVFFLTLIFSQLSCIPTHAKETTHIEITSQNAAAADALILPLDEAGETFHLVLSTIDNLYAQMSIEFKEQKYIDRFNSIVKQASLAKVKVKVNVGNIQSFEAYFMGMDGGSPITSFVITGITPDQAENIVPYFLSAKNDNIHIWGCFLENCKKAAAER